MGRGCHRQRVAEGADAAAGAELSGGERAGAGGGREQHHAEELLALAGDAGENARGFFPYTPATNLLYGLREAIHMLHEEGLPQVFARHARLAEATRRAVRAWGLEMVAARTARVQQRRDGRVGCRRDSTNARCGH